ncbi:hypothetical protein F4X10_17955 [Candidatus Poribacteria bacterium]|nr:hypothetical protein [Candidatus Poribacteria bacterium]
MHSTIPTREISPSELAECRENLKRQWENRRIDKELLQRAWEAAHSVATVLYQDFGATKVAIFGSLAEYGWFRKESDIDIAVWGLTDAQCRDARCGIADSCPEFKIDLINFEESTGLFRERVQSQAIVLKKGAKGIDSQLSHEYLHTPTMPARNGSIYEMNRSKLIQHIADERVKIERVIGSITELLEEIEVAVPRHRKFFEELTAKKLVEVYNGIERIFGRIAREVDMHIPSGSRWHNDLLEQMAELRPERPPVISQQTLLKLKDLLDFRHKINNIYSDELIYKKAEEHANPISELFATVSKELDTFAAFLSEI